MKKRIGIIGCGNMGTAIAHAAADASIHLICYDIDRKRLSLFEKRYHAAIASQGREVARECDRIVLAVKPNDVNTLLEDIRPELNGSKLLISVAAGITTAHIETMVDRRVAVVRVMPNMPALIGAGICAICKGRFATAGDLRFARRLFGKLGEVIEIKERLMNAVTAISGSGPAYFFYLVEIMIKAGVRLGLPRGVATKLAVQTALGSGRALKETRESPEALRLKVTSKGGTTEAAFKKFFKNNLEAILEKGIMAASERARELGKQ